MSHHQHLRAVQAGPARGRERERQMQTTCSEPECTAPCRVPYVRCKPCRKQSAASAAAGSDSDDEPDNADSDAQSAAAFLATTGVRARPRGAKYPMLAPTDEPFAGAGAETGLQHCATGRVRRRVRLAGLPWLRRRHCGGVPTLQAASGAARAFAWGGRERPGVLAWADGPAAPQSPHCLNATPQHRLVSGTFERHTSLCRSVH